MPMNHFFKLYVLSLNIVNFVFKIFKGLIVKILQMVRSQSSIYLNGFLNRVIDNEQCKHGFTSKYKEIRRRYVSNQLHCTEGPRGDSATCGWKLQQ